MPLAGPLPPGCTFDRERFGTDDQRLDLSDVRETAVPEITIGLARARVRLLPAAELTEAESVRLVESTARWLDTITAPGSPFVNAACTSHLNISNVGRELFDAIYATRDHFEQRSVSRVPLERFRARIGRQLGHRANGCDSIQSDPLVAAVLAHELELSGHARMYADDEFACIEFRTHRFRFRDGEPPPTDFEDTQVDHTIFGARTALCEARGCGGTFSTPVADAADAWAQGSVHYWCGTLCGRIYRVVLARTDGAWRVIERKLTAVSSAPAALSGRTFALAL